MTFTKYLFYILLFFYFPVNICAQTEESWGEVISKQFRTQLEIFPQEKVYMHIDRYFYQPNDTAWFALYLVDAATHQRCQQPIEFYSPRYTIRKIHSAAKDLRKTLFWKPNLKTNESSEVTFDFYSADVSTTYTILIKGISDDGKLIHHTSALLINNENE